MRFLIIIAAFLLASCTDLNIGRNTDAGKKRQFINETLLGYTPVKHQGSSPLCWAYAMLATIETEHIQMGDSVNLSVDYVVRHLLAEQARQHFLSSGYGRITLRGTAPLLLRLISEYGVMPYDAYNAPSLNYKVLARRLQTMSETSHDLSQLSDRAQRLFDERIGYMPKNVYMLGAEYTPQQFAHSVYMLGEYTALTSFTHHPFDQTFAIEVPDNYSDELFYNVPIDVMMRRIERSLRSGHPVCWEGRPLHVPHRHCSRQQRPPLLHSQELVWHRQSIRRTDVSVRKLCAYEDRSRGCEERSLIDSIISKTYS